jgi:hypothetical protein
MALSHGPAPDGTGHALYRLDPIQPDLFVCKTSGVVVYAMPLTSPEEPIDAWPGVLVHDVACR